MRRVRVDPEPGVRQMISEDLGVDRRDHHVVVAVGNQRWLRDPGEPGEPSRIRDTPFDDRVVLGSRDLWAVGLVRAVGPAEGALDVLDTKRSARLRDLEEDAEQIL